MRFFKEYIIIAVILVIIFGIEFWTNNNLNSTFEWIRAEIDDIENKISENKESEAQEQFHKMHESWKKKNDELAVYMEHTELEKITEDIVMIESNFESNDMDKVNENIAELEFILKHIEEKDKVNIKNIF